MPTGYTDMIDRNPKLSTTDWIMTGLARAFGICVTLREDGMNLSEKQILERIQEYGKDTIKHHETELEKAKKKAKTLKALTEKKWHKLWMKSELEKKQANEQSIADHIPIRKRHYWVKNDLERILESPMIDQVTRNIVNFGLEQLKLVKSDCEPYIQEPESFEEYRKKTLESNDWDLKYHTEEKAKAEQRLSGRIDAYKRLRKDVELILVDGDSET